MKIQKILEQKILYVCGGHEATFITEISKDSFCEIDLRMILDNTDFENHLMRLNTQTKNNTNEKGD